MAERKDLLATGCAVWAVCACVLAGAAITALLVRLLLWAVGAA